MRLLKLLRLAIYLSAMLHPMVSSADDIDSTAEIRVIHDIRYREGPSKAWTLDLAVKKAVPSKPRPGIVIIHGGGWLEGDKSSFATRKHRVPENIIDFAALGFVAVTINYRMSGEAPFPAALEDCKNAVRWLRAHAEEYHLDKNHLGAYGNSAGGHLAMLLAMVGREAKLEGDGPYQEESSLVQAAASDSGPINLLEQFQENRLREVVRLFVGGLPDGTHLEMYRRASLNHWISPSTPPLLLIYGVADEQVPVHTANRFVAALDLAKHSDVSYFRLANVDHCPHSLVRIPFLKQVVSDFFVRVLLYPETANRVRRAGSSQ